MVSSRNQEALDQVAAGFKKDGLEAIGIACHIGEPKQLVNLVEKTKEIYGGVDILVNNAATNPMFGPLVKMESSVFDKIMNINVKACFSLANLCHPIMKSRGGGAIINISSVEGIKPSNGLGLYSVSKAALLMLTKTQANEWGPDGIRSNAICPGLVKTKFSKALWSNDKILGSFTDGIPLNRMAQPDEMAGLALFLASSAASYCTGGVYTCDGGFTIS